LASSELEDATITRIISTARSFDNTIFFRLKDEPNKEYRVHLPKALIHIQVNENVHIRFNDNRNAWVVNEDINATYVTYFTQIILSIGSIIFSIILCKIILGYL
jgi:hypothetical protein